MFNRTLCHWRPSRWEGAMERNKSEDLPCVLVDLDLQVYGLRIKTIFYPYFITHKSIATLRRIACRPKVNPNPSFWRTLPLPWYAEKEFWVDNLITCTQADWIINSKYFFVWRNKLTSAPKLRWLKLQSKKDLPKVVTEQENQNGNLGTKITQQRQLWKRYFQF